MKVDSRQCNFYKLITTISDFPNCNWIQSRVEPKTNLINFVKSLPIWNNTINVIKINRYIWIWFKKRDIFICLKLPFQFSVEILSVWNNNTCLKQWLLCVDTMILGKVSLDFDGSVHLHILWKGLHELTVLI